MWSWHWLFLVSDMSTSNNWGSPQAEFDVPYGNVAQNAGYALIANRYASLYGYDEKALAKIAVDQRTNALANPNAVFRNDPITIEDVGRFAIWRLVRNNQLLRWSFVKTATQGQLLSLLANVQIVVLPG